jgi:Ca-activated chloride channel family protein
MRSVTRFTFVALLIVGASVFAAPRAAVPSLSIAGDNGSTALALEALNVHVLIRGHLARTTYELTYRSSLPHDTDGDFAFPLPDGAEISDLGLYFNGHLRHGVAVERVQARSVYEQNVHRRVDPALAEWSASTRAFHFRVYPIPANGTKVVHIAIDQDLTSSPYELDLRYDKTVASFDLTIDSDAPTSASDLPLTAHATNAHINGTLRATRADTETALTAWSPEDKTWYASAPVRIHSPARAIDPASQVTLLYDVSSSATQRDDAKLREFLAAFLAKQREGVSISVVPFHIAVEAAHVTDAAGLDRTLAAIPLAGATNLIELLERLPSIRDSRIVLVTDGISSLGDSQRLARARDTAAKLRRPLTIVNASPSADDNFLAGLARATGGHYLDLTHRDPAAAAEDAMRLPTRMALMTHLPLRDAMPPALLVTTDMSVTVSARSRDAITAFPLVSDYTRRELPVHLLESAEEQDLVRRAWGRAKLHALLDDNAPPDDVLAHGRAFNELTPRTSLLVLDSWRDYEVNGIPMPPDVREQRDAEMAAMKTHSRQQMPSEIELRGRTEETPPHAAVWFMKGTVLETDGMQLPGVTVTLKAPNVTTTTVSDANGRFWLTAPVVPESFTITAELAGFNTLTRSYPHGAPKGSVIEITMHVASVAEMITVTAEAPLLDQASEVRTAVQREITSRNTVITDQLIAAIASNAPPMTDNEEVEGKAIAERLDLVEKIVAKLRTLSSVEDRFRYYVQARSVIGGEKLFQANAAMAIRDDAPELAVRWLTDLAEAYPDDAPTLRILGRVLDAWGRADLARLLFERALELAPDQPQTTRELALLGTKDRIDPSAELQVELMWDSNYSDVDLHVIEPDGEEVFFSHMKSKHDGWLHEDITTGFGPETYTIPRMQPGPYKIQLVYYAGDTTGVSMETLAHVIVFVRGERRDAFVTLTAKDDKRDVAIVNR